MKEERIKAIKEPSKGCADYQCDLCDKTKYPMISWGCTHDNDHIKTIVCLSCIVEIKNAIPDGLFLDLLVAKIIKEEIEGDYKT